MYVVQVNLLHPAAMDINGSWTLWKGGGLRLVIYLSTGRKVDLVYSLYFTHLGLFIFTF